MGGDLKANFIEHCSVCYELFIGAHDNFVKSLTKITAPPSSMMTRVLG